MTIFPTKAQRLAKGVPSRALPPNPRDEGIIGTGSGEAELINELLPRGTDVIRNVINRKEAARWSRSGEILRYTYKPGDILLGAHRGRIIGIGGDKPLVTCASARSGKSSTVILPTLYTYPGSMLVLDPKGELARATARHRREVLGQRVYVHDPSGCSGEPSSAYNPLAEVNTGEKRVVDEVDAIANTIVLEQGGGDGSFWTQISRSLVRGLIFYTFTLPKEYQNLPTVRQLIELTFPPLEKLCQQFEAQKIPNPHHAVQNALFAAMADNGDRFGGNLSGAGKTFLAMDGRLQGNVLSTARAELKFLASLTLQEQAGRSDFRLSELAEAPTTIYLCMSPSDLEEQFRWLRLIVRQALTVLERRGAWPSGKPRILFLMEEFPVLRHMPVMEQASAYFPGFGVRLWCVVQDLSQLKRYYKSSWSTFLGNAGVLQFFANADKDTLDYISDRGGSLSFVRGSIGAVDANNEKGARDHIDKERLIYGHEAAYAFSKDKWSQCLFVAGENPMAISRLTHEQVDRIRKGGIG